MNMQKCKAQSIIPHRSYRRLKINKAYFITEVAFYVLFSVGAVYLYIIYLFNQYVCYFKNILHDVHVDVSTAAVDIAGFPVMLLDSAFAHSQPLTLFFVLVGMIVLFFVLKMQRVIPYNIAMWINFFLLMFMVILLYFLFWGDRFPYSFVSYFELYLTALIGMMLFSFIITGLAIALTPAPYWMKLTTFFIMVFYYIGYSLVRYGLTVLLTSQVSIVMAPIMFFTLYFDFIFFISIYSYFLYRSALLFKKKDTSWKW